MALLLVCVRCAVIRAPGHLLAAISWQLIATPVVCPTTTREAIRRALSVDEVRP